MLRLAKRYPLSASHRLHTNELSDEENQRLFGKCNNPFGHGHNYVIEVRVRGKANEVSGMLLRRDELDRLVHRAVLDKLDHANLNTDVAEFKQLVPTTENLTLLAGQWLQEYWNREFSERPVQLDYVRVEETARNTFELTYG